VIRVEISRDVPRSVRKAGSAFGSSRPTIYDPVMTTVARSWKAALLGIAVASAAGSEPGSFAAPLCGVLKAVGPRTRGLEPEAARAQLVRAIAAAFDYDAARLKEVRAQIDQATLGACAKDREVVLVNTKAKTLAEAIE